jgi:hypothetical protein
MASAVSTHESNFQNINELLEIEIKPENIQTDCILNKSSKGSSSSSSSKGSKSSSGSKGSKGSLSGGIGQMIDLNNFKALVFLAHGRIELNRTTILTPEIHPTIDVTAFPNVTNLAYMGIAPAGIVNVGTIMELATYRNLIDNELQKALEQEVIKLQFTPEIQKIEDKANEVIGNKKSKLHIRLQSTPSSPQSSRSPSPPPRSSPPPYQERPTPSRQSFFSRICKFCFSIIPTRDIVERFVASIASGEIVGYTFKGLFNICKTILPSTSLDGGAPKRKRQTNNASLCSISPDTCIMLLDGLRKSVKKFDSIRFDAICNLVKSSNPKYDNRPLLANKNDRCRKFSIIKGFDSTELLPFVNKYLAYNTLADKILNMGVSILSFKINSSGKVKCVIEDIDAEELMRNITKPSGIVVDPANPADITFWSTMEDCIKYCMAGRGPDQTLFVLDLSCASFSFTAQTPIDSVLIGMPGGNKKSRTRKIKNKSKNIKYKKNRRRIINKKNKTKKI